MEKGARKKESHFRAHVNMDLWQCLPLDMTPYSFGGESVKEKAIVAFPRVSKMLFGRSLCSARFSDLGEKTISGWFTFVVVSLTRDAVKWAIKKGERERFTKH